MSYCEVLSHLVQTHQDSQKKPSFGKEFTGIMMYLSRMEFIKRPCETLLNHHLLRLGLLTCLTFKNPLNQSLLNCFRLTLNEYPKGICSADFSGWSIYCRYHNLSSLGAKIGRIIENCKNLTIFLYLSQMALMTQIFEVPQKGQKEQKF